MKRKIKAWIVQTAFVNQPYKKDWTVSLTLNGYDYFAKGNTIEEAYNRLTDRVFESEYLLKCFRQLSKF